MRSKALLAACLFAAVSAHAETLERIMAVVDDRPIFLSDVRAVEAMDGVTRKDALERLIDETLLAREAERLPPPSAPAEGAPSAAAVPRTVARAQERRAAIRRYATFRFRPQVRVDEADVRKAYAHEWSGKDDAPPFDRVSSEIRDRLIAAEVEARVSNWVRDLRTAARIRYNPPD